ncbi:hypothetical protein D3C72_1990000 [compost metagenome]
MLIRSIDIIGAQADLPALCSTCRTSDIVLAIDLVHMRSFHSKMTTKFVRILEAALPNFDFITFDRFNIRIQLC